MTDEEKAKEWVRTNSGYSTKEFHGQKAIEAFLAGLEAGKDMAETDLATVAYMQGDKRKMNDIKGIIEDVEKSSLVSSKVIKKVIKIIGQEEWNNIHDEESDICTTTGELIITLKGIAELDCQMNRNKFCYSCTNATDRCFRNEIGCPCEKYKSYKDENVEMKKQLTKAKEIIKEMLSILPKENIEGIYEITEEAEQFLRENE